MTNRRYSLPAGKSVRDIANAVRDFLTDSENMETQVLRNEAGEYYIQARIRNWKIGQWFGLDKKIRVRLIPRGENTVTAEIGNGEWLKKVLTMVISMAAFWPLAITSAAGMLKQGSLPGKIDRAVRQYLADPAFFSPAGS